MVAHAQLKGVQNGTNNSRNSWLNFLERFTSDATAPFFFTAMNLPPRSNSPVEYENSDGDQAGSISWQERLGVNGLTSIHPGRLTAGT